MFLRTIFALAISFFLSAVVPFSAARAAFSQAKGKPSILVCEVKCHSVAILQDRFVEALEGKIIENLQATKKFRIVHREPFEVILQKKGQQYADHIQHQYNHLHMANVIESGDYSKYFRDGFHEDMIAYAGRYGSPRFQHLDEDVFQLGGEELVGAKDLAAEHDANYLLFCSIQKVGVSFGQMASLIGFSRQKRLFVAIDYYFINPANGKVFHDRSYVDKSSNQMHIMTDDTNIAWGKNHSLEALLNTILTNQAKRIAKNVSREGLEAVKVESRNEKIFGNDHRSGGVFQ